MGRAARAAVRARTSTRTRRGAPSGSVRASIVVPVYRDPERIGGTVARIRDELTPLLGPVEIVVVDDGSGDGSAEAARAAGADQVLVQPVNRGKGAAVRRGMLAATGRTLVFTDADLSYGPAQIARLVEAIEDGWDVVVGDRHHDETRQLVAAPWLREAGGRVVNAATRLVVHGRYRDTQCGLKAFRSDVARIIFAQTLVDGFAFDVEVFLLVERYGLSLLEVPVEVENSERSTVRVARDAARLFVDLARIRLDDARGRYAPEPGVLASLARVAGP